MATINLNARIVDRRVLHLINDAAGCPGGRTDDREGNRATEARDNRASSPAPPLSPLLPIYTCAGSCWDGRSSGWSEVPRLRIVPTRRRS